MWTCVHMTGSSEIHYPKVLRLHSTDGGRTASSQTTVIDMFGERQRESHQISNRSIGPDGKLYVHMGDGFEELTAQDEHSFRGKILRMNLDGTAPSDNFFFGCAQRRHLPPARCMRATGSCADCRVRAMVFTWPHLAEYACRSTSGELNS